AARDDDGNLLPDEFRCQLRQTIVLAIRPAVFDLYVLPVYVAAVPETLQKTAHIRREGVGRCAVEEAHHGHRLLPARGHRPRNPRSGEKRDELAPPHSITSSAMESSVGGTSTPIARAVARLMMNSNRVARVTGRSEGFSPLRMRPV